MLPVAGLRHVVGAGRPAVTGWPFREGSAAGAVMDLFIRVFQEGTPRASHQTAAPDVLPVNEVHRRRGNCGTDKVRAKIDYSRRIRDDKGMPGLPIRWRESGGSYTDALDRDYQDE